MYAIMKVQKSKIAIMTDNDFVSGTVCLKSVPNDLNTCTTINHRWCVSFLRKVVLVAVFAVSALPKARDKSS